MTLSTCSRRECRLAGAWRQRESTVTGLATVSKVPKVRVDEIGPGFRNANVAHTGFDHRT
jgi:hypothetical protein